LRFRCRSSGRPKIHHRSVASPGISFEIPPLWPSVEPIAKLGEGPVSLPGCSHGMATALGGPVGTRSPGAPASQAQPEGRPAPGGSAEAPVERVLHRGSFAPAKKGAPKSARPSAGRAQSGWYSSMARVLRWEHTWTRRPRRWKLVDQTLASGRPARPAYRGPGGLSRPVGEILT
jgi:hypothetical protein